MSYRVSYSARARRALAQTLPEAVAAACLQFIGGDLAESPHRVGKPLRAPLEGLHSARRGSFRVIYRIDDEGVTVLVVTVDHRRDAYRS